MRSQLKPDETLIVEVRQHWIKLVPPFLLWLVFTILLVKLLSNIGVVMSLIAMMMPLYLFIEWRYNLWAVTSQRVIDEKGFITRYSRESPIDKINDVEYTQPVIGRIIGYGNVRIQTAAEMGDVTYTYIEHPKQLKDAITFSQEAAKKEQLTQQANQMAQAFAQSGSHQAAPVHMVADELQKLFQLMQQGAITPDEYAVQKQRLLNK
jgi:uncharacterized membrane protein YdbT with pleckstrin-like domain